MKFKMKFKTVQKILAGICYVFDILSDSFKDIV